jgi:putative ABC transport system permease protein
MALVESRLAERLRNALPPDAPSVFLLDVQPDQQEDVLELFEIHGAIGARIVPVVTARLSSIDGVDVREIATRRDGDEVRRPRWVLTREQRLTWLKELPSDNVIVEGALWSDPERAEMSLEQGFAEDLGAKLGTKLVFDVQGVPIETVVTSIRTVEWESFSINFFLTAEPGVFDAAPHLLLAAGRLPQETEQAFQDELAEIAPNVTPIRVRSIVERVLEILGKLAAGVRMLGAYTVLVGLAILAGVAGAAAVQRAREVALLKSLGVRRTTIAGLFATEYGLLGAVAGLIGGLAAAILAWAFLTHVVEAGGAIAWWTPLAAAAGAALLTAVCGLLASIRALRARPIETLRG